LDSARPGRTYGCNSLPREVENQIKGTYGSPMTPPLKRNLLPYKTIVKNIKK
jgi:hypothetical protein